MRRIRCAILCGLALLGAAAACLGLEPPRAEQLDRYRADGTLEARVERARTYGNHKVRPGLAARTLDRLAVLSGAEPERELQAPLPYWEGMPTTGTNKVLVFLIDFPDYPHTNTWAGVSNRVFGTGSSSEFPLESLRQYYIRSSYSNLYLEGTVFDWYTMTNNRAWYTNEFGDGNYANAKIVEEVARYWDHVHDYSQYDNDGDGEIDYFAVIWAGPHDDWAEFWWGYQWSLFSMNLGLDGVRFYDFSWQWETYDYPDGVFEADVIIHETGHTLGLPDYYDYDGSVGPDGGVGDLDMMDATKHDHNGFSKFMLEWITPTVVTGALYNHTLNPAATHPETIIVMPGLTGATTYTEYFMAQNRFRIGNDTNMPSNGMLIWHVDATPDASGNNFRYDNSYTEHKLLRLVEADGLEQIERNYAGNSGDFYNTGESFTPDTNPRSVRYDGAETLVSITNISQSGTQVTANFTVGEEAKPDPQLIITITNPASNIVVGHVVSDYTVQGTCGTSVVGQLRWTNALTGVTGVLAAASGWSVPAVALSVGTNDFTLTGTNRPGRRPHAYDSATNSVYSDGWTNNDFAGTGFGGWFLENDDNSGFFTATLAANTNMDIASTAWGLWANSDDTASAVRNLNAAMGVGTRFEVAFENNWVDGGRSVGVAWRNGLGEYVLEFLFSGGGSHYTINDATEGRNTGVGWTGAGVSLVLELTSTNTYKLTMNGAEMTGTLKSRADTVIRQFRAWNYSAGSGGNYDVFLGNMTVTRPPWEGRSTNATVRIVREGIPYYVLDVLSAYGSPSPAVGSHTNAGGTVLTNRAGDAVISGLTQFVCVGWTMTGNDPAGGAASELTMTVTNHATLRWLWATNYWLDTAAGAHGAVNVGDGWRAYGATTQITATAEEYYHFTNWSGDASGSVNPLDLFVDAPKSVAAVFAATLTSNETPQWWLASHGWTDDFENVSSGDQDEDELFTWQEWIAQTDPTNAADVFVVTRPAPGGEYVIEWPSRSNRLYTIYWQTNLVETPGVLADDLEWPQASYTDETHSVEERVYYRVRVRLP